MHTRSPRRARTPVRTCVGCRRAAPADELVRCRAGNDGRVLPAPPSGVDPAGGRGAWVCGPECAAVAIQRRAFERALRSSVDTTGVVAAVTAQLAERQRAEPAC